MATAGIRESQREIMAAKRAAERDLKIPAIKCPDRRAECEHNDALWLRTYLPNVFYNPFTPDQLSTIEVAGNCLDYGLKKCKAAPRGDGKSSTLKYLALKRALYGQIRFVLLINATGPKADDSLKSIKSKLRAVPGSPLFDDFPFECSIARYIAPAPARANNVTVNGGKNVHCEWAANRLILPTLAESEPIGPIVMSLGYESEQLQGCNVFDVRPDFVLLDDLDSRESLAAVDGTIAKKIETIIDQTIGGLGGPGRRLGQFFLCTVTSRNSAAYRYSDPTVKPAFSGERSPRIKKWPERTDLWEEYIALRQKGQQTLNNPQDQGSGPVDPFGREAHRFFEKNLETMHQGSDISNPYDFDQEKLPDGTQKHLSALQKCYDYISDHGMESFLTEHQNDPPKGDEPESSQITSSLVGTRISGLEHRELPHGCEKIVSFIDLGEQFCTWTDSSWRGQCIGSVLDNGTLDVQSGPVNPSTNQRDPKTLELALLRVLHEWRDQLIAKYRDSEDQPRMIDLALIDSGSGPHTKAVYRFCRDVGHPFYPSKGQKDGWRIPKNARKHGDRWALVPQPDGTLLYEFEATYWKQFTHLRLLTPTFDENNQCRAGSLSLFVCPQHEQFRKDRREFTHQVVGEVWGVKKTGQKPSWIIRGKNHYLDALAGNCMAANAVGIRLVADLTKKRRPAAERPTLAQMAELAKKR